MHKSKSLFPLLYISILSIYAFSTESAGAVLIFALFSAVYIQIPGMLILMQMKGSRKIDSELILHAFFLGMGFLILEYFIFGTIGLRILFILFNPVLAAVLLKRSHAKINKLRLDGTVVCDSALFLFFIICLLFACINQLYAFSDIHNYTSIYLYQDLSWHIGNVTQLSRGMPFPDFRFFGLKFNYHYFNDLIFAMCKYIFNLTAWELVMKCTPVLTAYTFSLGIHALFSRYRRPLLGATLFILCGAADTFYLLNTDVHSFLLNYHIFSNINGVAVSLAAIISAYLFYIDIYDETKTKLSDLIILMVLVFVMTGLKGPFAVVMIAAMLFTGAIRFIEDHNLSRFLIVSIAEGGSFLATYLFIIKGIENLFRENNNNRATNLSISGTFSKSKFGAAFSDLLNHGDTVHVLVYCFFVAVIGGLITVGIYYLLFMADTIFVLAGMIKNKKVPAADRIVSIAAGWIGLAGFFLVSHVGFSQGYFMFVSILFIVLESIRLVDNTKALSAKRLLIAIMIVNTIVCGRLFFIGTADTMKDDSKHFVFYKTASENNADPSVVTHEELEGLEWIRDNTDPDSIISTDRLDMLSNEYPSAEKTCRFFCYSAFSERQMFIEGYSYSDISVEKVRTRLEMNKPIFSANPDEAQSAIKESGTDYIIISKRLGGHTMDRYKPVFANDDIAVYDARSILNTVNN